ncbi:acyl-CoA/acyl-ACP dehydrogenase [Micrococcales bacterium 31B]|nr:acyl-CoA/acyl-ACP dehydrogenase [Micrococcales bacterium 31B]
MAPTTDTASLSTFYSELAPALDAGTADVSQSLAYLGRHGLLDLGIDARLRDPHDNSGIAPAADLLSTVGGLCLSSAFSLWAHRMTLDFFARGTRSDASEERFAKLRTGELVGSTAMAIGMKHLAGLSDLLITVTEGENGGHTVAGAVPWASNLFDNAVMVTPAHLVRRDGTREKIVIWLDANDSGIDLKHITNLLALSSTQSATLTVNTTITDDNVLSHDFTAFATAFRPTFLLLQTAFCIGLASRCLDSSRSRRGSGDTVGLVHEIDRVDALFTRLREGFDAALDAPDAATPLSLFELRLLGCDTVVAAARLELSLEGGRGFIASSAAARRYREASFLPVQSPSEGHLRWQIARLQEQAA